MFRLPVSWLSCYLSNDIYMNDSSPATPLPSTPAFQLTRLAPNVFKMSLSALPSVYLPSPYSDKSPLTLFYFLLAITTCHPSLKSCVGPSIASPPQILHQPIFSKLSSLVSTSVKASSLSLKQLVRSSA